MTDYNSRNTKGRLRLMIPLLGGLLAVTAIMFFFAQQSFNHVLAAPIPPPEGYPKLSLSTKVVTPTLAGTGGETLTFAIEIINTGAFAAEGVTLEDMIPENTTFDAIEDYTVSPAPEISPSEDQLTWAGDIGFDSSGTITFSVIVDTEFKGIISNTAVIDHPDIPELVEVTAEATITDDPIFVIEKTSYPEKPGPNKELVYELTVTNLGVDAVALPITVTDNVPANTTFMNADPDGSYFHPDGEVTWNRDVSLAFQESTVFTFSVTVDDVVSGTVITNDDYDATSPETDIAYGEPYTTTIVDPILFISKYVEPYPPGSNREMTYYLTVLNKGSEAEGLEVTDVVPDGVDYVDGGSFDGTNVTWDYPSLDTDESAVFTYTVYVGDVAEVDVLNETYKVCDENNLCAVGEVLTSVIEGPTFELTAELDPIAKKPGGGGGPVTPTLTIENLGPGSALDTMATIYFERISVSFNDMVVTPTGGSLSEAMDCGEKCTYFEWVGDINYGEIITFTTSEGQSTIGGEEGTIYTTTLVVDDVLGDFTTEPVTATATGEITHYANLIPTKSAPAVIGAGQEMVYTINVWNSGLSTDDPPFPVLTETLPANITFVDASDGGVAATDGDQTVISWDLPAMSPGDLLQRTFTVLVDPDLVSGTLIINDDYQTGWFDIADDGSGFLSIVGEPVTTTVKEVGLIDSYKTVTPTLARPGIGNVLTYTVEVVNSSPNNLTDVWVYDIMPWEISTYQRDVIASSGDITDDIISLDWHGNVGAYSSETITFTVKVDDDYEGPVTNTATIQHTSLITDVVVEAIAYITNDPVLQIFKKAAPDPVKIGNELMYTIRVVNLGQSATELEVWDTIPENTTYVDDSASASGELVDGKVVWNLPVLDPGEQQKLYFKVTADYGKEIVNSDYGVTCAEGVSAYGDPVITGIRYNYIYLPIVAR